MNIAVSARVAALVPKNLAMISALTPELVENQTSSSRGIEVRKAGMQDIPPLLDLINGYAAKGITLPRTEFKAKRVIDDRDLYRKSLSGS